MLFHDQERGRALSSARRKSLPIAECRTRKSALANARFGPGVVRQVSKFVVLTLAQKKGLTKSIVFLGVIRGAGMTQGN